MNLLIIKYNHYNNLRRYFNIITSIFIMLMVIKVKSQSIDRTFLCDLTSANPDNRLGWSSACTWPTCSTSCNPCSGMSTFFTCSNSRITQVKLTVDYRLSILPSSVVNLTSLSLLQVLHNQLLSLPEELGYHPILSRLEVTGNNIQLLPESIGQLPILSANFAYNPIVALPDSIGSLTRITRLDFLNTQFPTLPTTFTSLSTLRWLSISENTNFTSLPDDIGSMNSLTYLNIAGSERLMAPIDTFPESISNLNLITLIMNRNMMSTLPNSILHMTSLSYLQLVGTQFAPISPDFSLLTRLTYLSVSENSQLTAFHPGVCKLTNLKTLGLSYTRVNNLPDCIGDLTEMVHWSSYSLSNQLRHIPHTFFKMTQLTTLGVGSNGLRDFQFVYNVTKFFKVLRHLDIRGNSFNSDSANRPLPEDLGTLVGLTLIRMESNKWNHLPTSIGNLVLMSYLNLHNNLFTSIPDSIIHLTNLRHLAISHNRLTSIPTGIGNLLLLTELAANNNQITGIPDSIGSLRALRRLHIGSNNILSLPSTIGNLRSATAVFMNNNHLTSLPRYLNFSSCVQLDLSNNQLTAIPSSISNSRPLYQLILTNNRLSTLPLSLNTLPGLLDLRLDGNCFDCSQIQQMAYTTFIKGRCIQSEQDDSCVVKEYIPPNKR
jgi:Leucine-rich repeat (LRR) protein